MRILRPYSAPIPIPSQVYLVNRIDRGSSGLVLVTFDGPTAAKLQEALSSEDVSKEYVCIVRGVPAARHFDCHRPLTDKDSLAKTRREAHTSFCLVANLTVPLEEEFRADLPRTVGASDSRVTAAAGRGAHQGGAATDVAAVAAESGGGGEDGGGGAGGSGAVFRRDLAVSLLVARIFTGRRHQIRRHLQVCRART
jgi:hypothetical protein